MTPNGSDHDRVIRVEERVSTLQRGQDAVFTQLSEIKEQGHLQYLKIIEKLDEQCVSCPPAAIAKDHEARLRGHADDISGIKAEVSGAKKVAGAVAIAMSAGLNFIMHILRGDS